MKKLLLTLFLALLATLCMAAESRTEAPKAPPRKTPDPNPNGSRFLFVVDISSRMGKLDVANRQTLFDLIYLGVNHQIQPLDSFGVWTFNTKVYAGEFSMQVYEQEAILELASRAAFFLKSKKYTGTCEMELAIVNLASLVRNVKDLNIFILTDGGTPMRGTPFDDAINQVYKQRAAEQRKAEKPFITTLVVRGGAITNAIVTLPGEDIPLPARPVIVQATPPPPPPKPAAKPLIIKPTTPAPAAAPAQPETSVRSENGAAESNKIAAPVVNTLPADKTSEETSVKVVAQQTNSPVTPLPQVSTAKAAEEAPMKVIEKEPVPSTPKEAPEKTTVAAVVPTPATPPMSATPQVQQTVPTQAPDKPLGSQASPVSMVTPKPLFNPQLLIIAGGILLMGTLGLLVVVFRRIHKMTEPSIITRSMEHRS